jgi:serine/threonine protein phosphatase PrpC
MRKVYGMGGHNGGDIASQMSVKLLPEYLGASTESNPIKKLSTVVNQVNQSIFNHAKENPELEGMGTTITGALVEGGDLYIANVGDSRTYLLSHNKIFQLSKDHSLVQEKINVGIYDREQAKNDPQKNVLVRTVGFEENVTVDVYKYKIQAGDMFLLCSDGLSGKVHDKDILDIVNECIPSPHAATKEQLNEACQNLIDEANANGGQDNISVVLVVVQGKKSSK